MKDNHISTCLYRDHNPGHIMTDKILAASHKLIIVNMASIIAAHIEDKYLSGWQHILIKLKDYMIHEAALVAM